VPDAESSGQNKLSFSRGDGSWKSTDTDSKPRSRKKKRKRYSGGLKEMRAICQGRTISLTCETETEEIWAEETFGPRSKDGWKGGKARYRVKYDGKYATGEDQTKIQIRLEVR
jgi:hypothetical protein